MRTRKFMKSVLVLVWTIFIFGVQASIYPLAASDIKTKRMDCEKHWIDLEEGGLRSSSPIILNLKMEKGSIFTEYFFKDEGKWIKVCSQNYLSGRNTREKLDDAIKCTFEKAEAINSAGVRTSGSGELIYDFELTKVYGALHIKILEHPGSPQLIGKTFKYWFKQCAQTK